MFDLDEVHAEVCDKIGRLRDRVVELEAELAIATTQLTERQRVFCTQCGGPPPYGRAYRAATAAGYATPRSEGSRLVSMVKVRRVLMAMMDLSTARRGLSRLEAEAERLAEIKRGLDQDAAEFDAWVHGEFKGRRPALPGSPKRRRRPAQI